jgi:hypothetical protein
MVNLLLWLVYGLLVYIILFSILSASYSTTTVPAGTITKTPLFNCIVSRHQKSFLDVSNLFLIKAPSKLLEIKYNFPANE